eukprot:1706398-Alexandrium_andersonii.AAC.1
MRGSGGGEGGGSHPANPAQDPCMKRCSRPVVEHLRLVTGDAALPAAQAVRAEKAVEDGVRNPRHVFGQDLRRAAG